MQLTVPKNKIIITLVLFALLLLLFLPIIANAQFLPTIVLCEGPTGDPKTECNYGALIGGINRFLQFVIGFATVIAVVMFVYAGSLLIFSGGNKTQMDKAKTILRNVVVGFILVLAAWLIVFTILRSLIDKDKPIPKPLNQLGLSELTIKEYV